MKRFTQAVLAAGSLVFVASCAPRYQDKFNEKCEAAKYSKEQCDAARENSYRTIAGKETSDGKFEMDYTRLPMRDAIENVSQYVKDLKDWLDYKNQDLQQYAKAFGLRSWFEKQEQIFKSILAQLKAADLHRRFQREIGDVSSYYSSDSSRDGYDPSIFKLTDTQKAFPFTSKNLQDAKDNGLLQLIETYIVSQSKRFDHKEPDPAFPEDQNKFIWRTKQYTLVVTKYKVMPDDEQPKENYGNYLEAYRVISGKQESLPAIKVFLDGKGGTAIVLIDIDQESRDIGFGLPDMLERMPEADVLGNAMFARLFPDDESYKRIEPKRPPVRMEIARAGQPVDVWEKSQDSKGFVPPYGYKMEPLGDNYNVRVVRKKPKSGQEHVHGTGLEIDYIVKEYTAGERYKPSQRNVWEYFLPNVPYNNKVLKAEVQFADSSREGTKKLRFVFPDGDEDIKFITPTANKVISDKPRMIAYNMGEARWLLKDEDGDGIFEKKRQIDKPRQKTGEYEDPAKEYLSKSHGGAHGGDNLEISPATPEDKK